MTNETLSKNPESRQPAAGAAPLDVRVERMPEGIPQRWGAMRGIALLVDDATPEERRQAIDMARRLAAEAIASLGDQPEKPRRYNMTNVKSDAELFEVFRGEVLRSLGVNNSERVLNHATGQAVGELESIEQLLLAKADDDLEQAPVACAVEGVRKRLQLALRFDDGVFTLNTLASDGLAAVSSSDGSAKGGNDVAAPATESEDDDEEVSRSMISDNVLRASTLVSELMANTLGESGSTHQLLSRVNRELWTIRWELGLLPERSNQQIEEDEKFSAAQLAAFEMVRASFRAKRPAMPVAESAVAQ